VGSEIPVEPGTVFFGHLAQSAEIHVVFEVGQFHPTPEWIRRGPFHELFVILALAFCDRVQRIQNGLRETALSQPFHGPSIPVAFHDIVQYGHDPLLVRLDAEHDSKRMQDVRLTSPVLHAPMGFDRDLDCFFEE
jgi:hypothetical protein